MVNRIQNGNNHSKAASPSPPPPVSQPLSLDKDGETNSPIRTFKNTSGGMGQNPYDDDDDGDDVHPCREPTVDEERYGKSPEQQPQPRRSSDNYKKKQKKSSSWIPQPVENFNHYTYQSRMIIATTNATIITHPPSYCCCKCCSSNNNNSNNNHQHKMIHPRIQELYLSGDYWSLYIGLLSFGLALDATIVAVPLGRTKHVIPLPQMWDQDPRESFHDVYDLVGIPILGLLLASLYAASLVMRNIVTSYRALAKTGLGFAMLFGLATMALFLGRQEWCHRNGLGYAVFAICIGIIIGNVIVPSLLPSCLDQVAKDGEFFIKCSLVLLAVQLDTLISVGGPAILVAWIGSPIAVVAGYRLGRRFFHCNDALSMLIAVGASWCGASAISAVAPIVQADPADVALSISVVAFGALIFTFVQAYIAIWLEMPDPVAGAWIGASVDQTGNVIVSAAIVSPKATEIAGIVKMVLNAALGIMASVVACYWNSRTITTSTTGLDVQDGGDSNSSRVPAPPKLTIISLWDKFPKFTLGFVITSIVLTITLQCIHDTEEAVELPKAINALNQWWFAIAFTGIGLTTNLKTLATKAYSSGIIQVYLLANLINILLALGLAYIAYNVI